MQVLARSRSLAPAHSVAMPRRASRLASLDNDTVFPPVALEATNILSSTLVWAALVLTPRSSCFLPPPLTPPRDLQHAAAATPKICRRFGRLRSPCPTRASGPPTSASVARKHAAAQCPQCPCSQIAPLIEERCSPLGDDLEDEVLHTDNALVGG